MRKRKLFSQIFPTYLVLITLVVLFFAGYEQSVIKDFYLAEIRKDLEARARLIKEKIQNIDFSDVAKIDSVCRVLGEKGKVRITIIHNSGRIIADSQKDATLMDNHADRPEIIQAFEDKVGHSIRYSYTLEKNLIYLAIPHNTNNEIVYAVRIAYPLSALEKSIIDLRYRILLGGLFILFIGAVLSFYISRRISKPLEEIKSGAERFAKGQFEPHLPESGSSEIQALASSLNTMASEIASRIKTISLQKHEQEAMFRSMKEGVLAVNKQEQIMRINPVAIQFFDIKEEEPEKRLVHEVIRHKEVLDFIHETLESAEHLVREIAILNHVQHILRLTGTPLLNANGRIIGSLILIYEITRTKQLDKMRREFVANVSHELRTPITSIKGYVETLLDGKVEDQKTVTGFLEIIARQSDRMNAIITDLLQLSQIEQLEGQLPERSSQLLLPVIQSAIDECRMPAEDKHVQISIEGKTEAIANISAPLLEQAIINLLDNAIKYSQANSKIGIILDEDENEFRITVKDNGCGIEEKHHDRLFERFYRVDKGRSRELGGTGLGLAIVKHIANAHKGNVTLQSQPGKGSAFTFYIPKA